MEPITGKMTVRKPVWWELRGQEGKAPGPPETLSSVCVFVLWPQDRLYLTSNTRDCGRLEDGTSRPALVLGSWGKAMLELLLAETVQPLERTIVWLYSLLIQLKECEARLPQNDSLPSLA